jgi:hypothetical protein
VKQQITRLLAASPLTQRRRRRTAAEREARDVAAMASGHPESLTRPLRRGQDRRLTRLAGELWPGGDYEKELWEL